MQRAMLVTLDQLVFLEELGLLELEVRLEQLDLLEKRVFLAPSEHQAHQVIQVLPVPKE